MRRFVLPFAALPLLAGCLTGLAPERYRLESTARYGELVAHEEARTVNTSSSAADLYSLCYAYSKIKDYAKLFGCAAKLEARIAMGDRQVTLYTSVQPSDGGPTPYLLRAEAYLELGNYPAAVAEASEGLRRTAGVTTTAFGIEKTQHSIHGLGLLALAHALADDQAQAEQHLKALDDLKIPFSGSAQTLPMKHRALARVHMARRDFDKALDALGREDGSSARTLASLIVGGGENLYATLELPKTYMSAKSLLETGRIAEAREVFDRLLAMPQLSSIGEINWLVLFDRGRIAEQTGEIGAAIDYYRRAVEIVERQRATINTEANKIGFVGDKQAVYAALIRLLVADGNVTSAFEYVERSKSRALVDMLAAKKDFAVSDGNAVRVKELLDQADRSEAQSRLQDGRTETGSLRALLVGYRQELSVASPELASLVSVSAPKASEIQALLAADETLVEYYQNGENLMAFRVTSGSIDAVRLTGAGLMDAVRRFRDQLAEADSERYMESARQLHDRLILPLLGSLGTGKLVFVAHGPLHYLPFGALHDGHTFLIDRYPFRMLPSASVMKYARPYRVAKPGEILALGNPDLGDSRFDLAFAQMEVIAVTQGRSRSRALLRKEANEAAFRRYGAEFRYVHFATHGEFKPDAPLKSTLLLAKDAEYDGMLTADKLYSMKLDADLVTLSACETGIGKIASGDDIVGLIRGFLYAGSRSIVASLWKVDDEATSYLMTRFYDRLGHEDKRAALRQAQIETMKKFRHPFFWAAFQLTGSAM